MAAVALPFIGLIVFTEAEEARNALESAGNSSLNLAEVAASSTEQFILDSKALLAHIAPRALPYITNPECSYFQRDFANLPPQFTIIELINPLGQPLCATVSPPVERFQSVADRQWFQNILRDNTFTVSGPLIGRVTGKWSIVLAYPLNDALGRVIGVLALAVNSVRYQFELNSITLAPGSVITIIDDAGTVIARSPEPQSSVGKDLRGREIVDRALNQESGQAQATGTDGVDRIYGFTTLATDRWHVYVGIPTDAVLAVTRAQLLQQALLVLVMMLTVLVGAYLIGHQIAQPISALESMARTLARGQMEVRAPVEGAWEVAQVAARFNEMLDARVQAEKTLRSSEERFRALIEHSLDAILLFSASGETLYASPSIRQINGYNPAELVGKNRVEWVQPDDMDKFKREWSTLVEQPDKIVRSQDRGRHKDGRWLWIERVFHNLLVDPGVGAVVVNIRDITALKQAEKALRESEANFRGMFETVHSIIMMIDKQGNILDINGYTEKVLGYSPSELRHKNVFDRLYAPKDRPKMRQVLKDLAEGRDQEYEVRCIAKDGRIVTFAGSSTARFAPGGEFISTLCTYIDITERKRTEEALQGYTLRLETLHAIDEAILSARSLAEIAQAVLQQIMGLVSCQGASIYLLDFGTREVIVYAAQLGGDSRVAPGRRISFEDIALVDVRLNALLQGQVLEENGIAMFARRPAFQGAIVEGRQSDIWAPLRVKGDLIGLINLWADQADHFSPDDENIIREVADSLAVATSQVWLNEEIRDARDRLETLSRRLVEAQEAERRRLAQELHDQVGQQLSVLGINLSVLRKQLPVRTAEKVEARLKDSMKLVDEMVERIRTVVVELRPAMLDDFGLGSALRWYAELFSTRTGLTVKLGNLDLTSRLPSEIETALFRIAQEALTNVVKHSEANQVTITLEALTGMVRMTVSDNGRGFDLAEMRQPGVRKGLGLISMHERAEAVGGHLVVEATPGKGTQIIVEISN